jgi:hypothetical protein
LYTLYDRGPLLRIARGPSGVVWGDDEEPDYVFRSRAGGPIDPDNLDRAFRAHPAPAGLPQVRFRDLRHTHVPSLLISASIHPKAIQAGLGHASITTTPNTYGHLMPSAFAGLGERMDASWSSRLLWLCGCRSSWRQASLLTEDCFHFRTFIVEGLNDTLCVMVRGIHLV